MNNNPNLLYKQCVACKGKGFTIEPKMLCLVCRGTGAIKKEEK